jgi:hypothetical protein
LSCPANPLFSFGLALALLLLISMLILVVKADDGEKSWGDDTTMSREKLNSGVDGICLD